MSSKLTPEQLTDLKRMLEAKRDELRQKSRAHLRSATANEGGERSEVGDIAEQEIEIADGVGLAEHEQRVLEEVLRALERIERGSYGVSAKTGLPIPYARLAAVPWATTGVDE
jgi:DnaK suppressor protein